MVITRRWAVFLTAVGVWTWLIWPRFALAISRDDRSFVDGAPAAFFWIHALLIAASLAIGTAVGVLGVRAWRASGRPRAAEESVAGNASGPQD
jgi:hypothetical protein